MRGDSVEIIPSDEEIVTRIQFWGDEIEKISKVDPLTGEVLSATNQADIFPAKHWVTSQDRLNVALKDIDMELKDQLKYLKSHNKLLEAQRLEQRTRFDVDLMRETGSCPGIENYSRFLPQSEQSLASRSWCNMLATTPRGRKVNFEEVKEFLIKLKVLKVKKSNF